MINCEKCEKVFKTNWHLQRHLSKKRPCKSNKHNESSNKHNESLNKHNESLNKHNESLNKHNESSKKHNETHKSCEYCNKTFTTTQGLSRHLQSCKEKNDAVRYLEIQLGIDLKSETHKHKCRFCEYESQYTSNVIRHSLSCEAKEAYKEHLQNMLKEKNENVMEGAHTINITNNTINIHVNSLGNEDMSYITTKALKKLWNSVRTDEEGVAKTIKMIHGSKDHPENHNIIYTNLRSNVAMVKVDNDFEYKNINEVLKDVSINTLDAIILSTEYDDLSKFIKAKYEKVCEDEEMNKEASIQAKTELYNSYKKGDIKKS